MQGPMKCAIQYGYEGKPHVLGEAASECDGLAGASDRDVVIPHIDIETLPPALPPGNCMEQCAMQPAIR